MTPISKALTILCAALVITVAVLWGMNASKAQRIADLQHAAELSAVRIESMEYTNKFKDGLLNEWAADRTTLKADNDSLAKLIKPHGKPRVRPASVPAIRDTILSTVRMR